MKNKPDWEQAFDNMGGKTLQELMADKREIKLEILEELYRWFTSIYKKDDKNKGAEFVYKGLVIRIFWDSQTVQIHDEEDWNKTRIVNT